MKIGTIFVAALITWGALALAQDIPAGTALPVVLNTTLESKKLMPGDAISAVLVQEVPLPGGGKIRAGAQVAGRVLKIDGTREGGTLIRFRFDHVHDKGRDIPIVTTLRALASPWEVQEAQTSKVGAVERDASANLITTQIGGDVVYRGGGQVMHGEDVVGDPVKDGVLAVLRPVAKTGCDTGSGERRLALWLFSSTACGVYGFRFLEISQPGTAEPVGEVVVQAKKNVHIDRGAALLLITVEAPKR
jgi:hypothetical protein